MYQARTLDKSRQSTGAWCKVFCLLIIGSTKHDCFNLWDQHIKLRYITLTETECWIQMVLPAYDRSTQWLGRIKSRHHYFKQNSNHVMFNPSHMVWPMLVQSVVKQITLTCKFKRSNNNRGIPKMIIKIVIKLLNADISSFQSKSNFQFVVVHYCCNFVILHYEANKQHYTVRNWSSITKEHTYKSILFVNLNQAGLHSSD